MICHFHVFGLSQIGKLRIEFLDIVLRGIVEGYWVKILLEQNGIFGGTES